jgi:hypothetical protein
MDFSELISTLSRWGGFLLLLAGALFVVTLAVRGVIVSMTPGARMGRVAVLCAGEAVMVSLFPLLGWAATALLILTVPIMLEAISYRWCMGAPDESRESASDKLKAFIFMAVYPGMFVVGAIVVFLLPWHA